MLTLKQGLKLSAIADKMDITITNPSGKAAEVGADLMQQAIRKAYKAEKEIYTLISEVKGISEQEAEKVDLAEIIKEMTGNKELLTFFK